MKSSRTTATSILPGPANAAQAQSAFEVFDTDAENAEAAFACDGMLARGKMAGERSIVGWADALTERARSFERIGAEPDTSAITHEIADTLGNSAKGFRERYVSSAVIHGGWHPQLQARYLVTNKTGSLMSRLFRQGTEE